MDVAHTFAFTRPGVHDTQKHLSTLQKALDEHAAHPLHSEVAGIADGIFHGAPAIPDFDALPQRICHGDFKISNFLFDDDDEAVAVIDLDTMAHSGWPVDLADALRSWVNPIAEDAGHAEVDRDILEAALSGYGSANGENWEPMEVQALIPATVGIALELCARFCADALNENYFGWNPKAFPSRGHHNLARARGQWDLHKKLKAAQPELESLLRTSGWRP
jgi:Ser/Thr protein kinase RdoA (MazF antagonist)